jgi:hypothetical protein
MAQPAFTWTETPRGNWICSCGEYAGVCERRGDRWDVRVQSPYPMRYAFDYASIEDAKGVVESIIMDVAIKHHDLHRLAYVPHAA